MRRVFRVIGCIVFIAISVTLYTNLSAHAETPAENFGIGPLRSELQIAAGTTYPGQITLNNNGDTNLSLTLSAQVFSVTDENYDYAFSATAPATKWVQFSSSTITLAPHSQQTINYQLAVPIGAEPGGRYISLFATTNPVPNQTGITPVERVASLLYITIPGGVTRLGSLLDLQSPTIEFDTSTWSATVNNRGTVHFRSTDSVTLSTIFGQKITSAQTSALILPSTVRLVTNSLPHPAWIGIYKATYVVSLGDLPAQTVTHWLFYAPMSQFIPLVCMIAAIGLYIYVRSSRRRHKKVFAKKSH